MQPSWLNAFVLHRRPYRETSFIVDFFSAELGRISVVAKGVRKAKSDRKSLLQPFQALRLQISGKSDLKNLTQLEAAAPTIQLHGDALYCGLYVNELINRVLPTGMEVADLYPIYSGTLSALAAQQDQFEWTLRRLELNLLQELGVMPDLFHDAQTHQAITAEAFYRWAPELGFCLASAKTSQCFAGADILALAKGQLSAENLPAAKRLCRMALLPFIGDKPLKSRELFLVSR